MFSRTKVASKHRTVPAAYFGNNLVIFPEFFKVCNIFCIRYVPPLYFISHHSAFSAFMSRVRWRFAKHKFTMSTSRRQVVMTCQPPNSTNSIWNAQQAVYSEQKTRLTFMTRWRHAGFDLSLNCCAQQVYVKQVQWNLAFSQKTKLDISNLGHFRGGLQSSQFDWYWEH